MMVETMRMEETEGECQRKKAKERTLGMPTFQGLSGGGGDDAVVGEKLLKEGGIKEVIEVNLKTKKGPTNWVTLFLSEHCCVPGPVLDPGDSATIRCARFPPSQGSHSRACAPACTTCVCVEGTEYKQTNMVIHLYGK